MALIPSLLTPRLPADFTGNEELADRGADARLIVFSGLPGTGKSTLAGQSDGNCASRCSRWTGCSGR